MHKAWKEGSPETDTGIINLLASLDITPGEHADESAVQKAQEWVGIEDEEGVEDAMNLGEADDLAKAPAGIDMGGSSLDSEEGENDDTRTGGGEAAPPSYAEFSRYFGPLDKCASLCGLGGGWLLFSTGQDVDD